MGVRKCSMCGKTGHNSRTCTNLSSTKQNCSHIMKLFGVEFAKVPSTNDEFGLREGSNFTHTETLISGEDSDKLKHIGTTNQVQRKKGIPWSEEEHRLFLLGLEKLGKGNWRGISRNFVTTRTSTQVASHAQKYFLRRNNKTKFIPTLLSMVRRNEAQYCCIYSKKQPNNIMALGLGLDEAPNYFCRLINNSATQINSPNLDLTLSASSPLLLWKKQYVL